MPFAHQPPNEHAIFGAHLTILPTDMSLLVKLLGQCTANISVWFAGNIKKYKEKVFPILKLFKIYIAQRKDILDV